jgi:hypothetical protein
MLCTQTAKYVCVSHCTAARCHPWDPYLWDEVQAMSPALPN